MSNEDLKEKEKDKEGWAAFMQWIYNSETGQFLGRTGTSWAKVGIFYLIFYTCLAIFWGIMMKVFLATISFEKPKWTLDDSLIGVNPGLGFRPSPKVEKVDSTLIHFRPGQNASYYLWVKDLNDYLQPYREAYKNHSSRCPFPIRRENCPFIPNVDNNPCGQNFGYDTGSPCVLIKLNRVYDWKPRTYRSFNELKEDVRNRAKGISIEPYVSEDDITAHEGQISVQCEGEHTSDKEKLSKISYWPRQGFPSEYYPFTNQENYLSPFVLVKFNNPQRGKVINIECIAMDKSIAINSYDREGSVSYQLLIDN